MSKGLKITLLVLVTYIGLSLVHVRLNIGFDKLNFSKGSNSEASFRVGFLPVT